MFDAILNDEDAARATAVVDALVAAGLHGALTGSLAIEAHRRARGKPARRRPLNDVDLVVEAFDLIPESVADRFLLHHVHPSAPEGKILVQLIDPERAVRVDVFRTIGRTLSRSVPLGVEGGRLDVVSLEDLVARTTAHVYGRIRAGRTIDTKYAQAFLELADLGRETDLQEAWHDHRGEIDASFAQASSETRQILALRPELVIVEKHSPVVTACERCRDQAPFRRASPERIVQILGYW